MFFARLNNIRRSTTFRLGLRFMALFAVSFLILGTFVYFQTIAYMEQEVRSVIEGELAEVSDFYAQQGVTALAQELDEHTANDPTGIYVLLDAECKPVAGGYKRLEQGTLSPMFCEEALAEDGWLEFELDRQDLGFRNRVPEWDDDVYARLVALSGKHRVIIGRMAGNQEEAAQLMQGALSWGLLVMVGLALLGSLIMGRTVTNRLERINRISQEIRHGDLSRRMPLDRGGDEFDRLASNLNDMLDQIQSLMDGVRAVSDAIAHDLRTPLTRLRTRLEGLRDNAESGALDEDIDQSIQEADNLLTTFNALLRIAQIESGGRRADFAEVKLDQLVTDVTDLYEPLAAERNVDLKLHAPESLTTSGDRDLLFQAVSNLVDNAIKYTPEGGRIEVGVQRAPSGARVVVADSGPGIPFEEREQVFERFYRRETHRNSAGSGLGLSLVAAVAKLHGGRVVLEDNRPGLRVVWDLPAA